MTAYLYGERRRSRASSQDDDHVPSEMPVHTPRRPPLSSHTAHAVTSSLCLRSGTPGESEKESHTGKEKSDNRTGKVRECRSIRGWTCCGMPGRLRCKSGVYQNVFETVRGTSAMDRARTHTVSCRTIHV